MRAAVAAGGIYFAAVFVLGFALGVFRTLLLLPTLGDTVAVAVELPVILCFAWFVCGRLIRRSGLSSAMRDRLAMGAVAFGLLIVAEVAVSRFFAGRSLVEHVALYRQAPHQLRLMGQIAFALFPVLQRLRRRGSCDHGT